MSPDSNSFEIWMPCSEYEKMSELEKMVYEPFFGISRELPYLQYGQILLPPIVKTPKILLED